jgi:hypothetical protein
MNWKPMDLAKLESLLATHLADCTDEQRCFFETVRIEPTKWRLSPWGDLGGGFWVVAVHRDRVIWFNDIEDGFEVSRFEVRGEIPEGEYRSSQYVLRWALARLGDESDGRP